VQFGFVVRGIKYIKILESTISDNESLYCDKILSNKTATGSKL